MYEDLVRDLRHDGNIILKCGSPIFKVKQGRMMVDAADAIEQMREREKFHAFIWNTLGHGKMMELVEMYHQFDGEDEDDV